MNDIDEIGISQDVFETLHATNKLRFVHYDEPTELTFWAHGDTVFITPAAKYPPPEHEEEQ